MTWVYIRTEETLWTVGFYRGENFESASDHGSEEEAAARVHYLNGGPDERAIRAQLTQEIGERCVTRMSIAITNDCPSGDLAGLRRAIRIIRNEVLV